jgi:hypothetical protein
MEVKRCPFLTPIYNKVRKAEDPDNKKSGPLEGPDLGFDRLATKP